MNPTSAPESDLMPASRRGRILSAVMALCACAALLAFQFIAMPLLLGILGDNSGTPPSGAAVRKVQALFAGLGLIGVTTAGILIWNARKILRTQQTPPDDLWIWRDTKIVRGPRARRIAFISLAAAGLTALLCLGLATYIILTLDRIAPYALRQGVTIVHESSWKE